MWNSIVFCTLLVLTLPRVDAKSKKTKSVTTLLDAKWNVTPLVLEVAEYLADENIDYFWSFIDSISALDPPLAEIENDRDRYEKVLSETSKILSPSEISVLKFGLSLHVYSPKVEMFERIAIDRNLKDCRTVADVGGRTACGVEEMKTIVGKTTSGDVETFKIDHHYPGSENNTLKVVLYGEIGDPEFSRFHRELVALASSGKVDYVVRHFVKDRRDRRLRLSGYGVELQMKSTEYKAQDDTQIKREESSVETSQEDEDEEIEGFNFSRLKNLYPDRKTVLNKFRQHLVESSSELTPLKVWQFQELSLQAAERIMRAPREEALHTLTHIAQNFPTQAKSLVRTVVDPKLKNEIKLNQDLFASTLNLQPSDTALFINGMFFDLDVVDVVSLLEVIRREQRVMHGLHRAGIVDKKLQALLTVDLNDNGAGGVQEFAVDIRDSAVIWVNDIESDAKYRHWSSSLMELLRPTFPGMLRSVRKNLYNLVLIIDPADLEAKPLLKLLESFYVHTAPLRLGLVFAVDDRPETTGSNDPGVALLCAYNYVAQLKDSGHALGFITDVYAAVKDDRPITVDDVIVTLRKEYPKSDPDEILGEDSDFDFGRRLASDFIRRTGLSSPAALFNGVSLAKNQLNADEFEEAVLTEVMQQTPVFQKAIYRGEFSDGKSAIDFIMDRPNVMPRLNQRVLDQRSSDFIDTSGRSIDIEDVPALLKASNRDMTATAIRHLKYFRSAKNADKPHALTYWIVGDLNCEKSRELLLAALKYTKGNSDTRVTFLPNVEQSPGDGHLLNKLVLATLDVLPVDRATQFMISILEDASTVDTTKYPAEIRSAIPEQDIKLKMLRVYCRRVFSFGVGKRGVVVNGRVLGPFDDDERFDSEDFLLLERHAMSTYGDKITKALKAVEDDVEEITSDQLLRAIPLLISRSQSRSRFEITYAGAEHSVVTLPATKPDEPTFELTAIVDPVSRGAQKLGPILGVLQSILNCNVRVFLNCVEKNSDMPLKSFYRFVLEPEIQFLDDGRQSPGPTARFYGLPTAPLLTQNMLVPENWLVAVVRAVHDLDNIRLEDVDSAVHSEYELEYLLLEGHCFEATSGTPPRGLQITLGTESNPIQVDTIVMANLGYFQLKANPGAWILRLRQGRSADIYDIVSHDGSDTPAGSTDIKVLISSLRSHVLKLKVTKKPEMRHVDLLAEEEPSSGIWNSITSQFGGTIDEDAEEKINIFSLASGHLYERFLRIMMLSVLKNTKSPVKFWFLKNYLSPQFKDFLPHMAAEYGFDYELVEYKWPRWLHQQTEKQRIIWGYKILFLDVLFPLDIKKIIFVDADQVVRADMKELQRLDLGGAPYGYTPFCESRVEMDGFRFWKQGYWRNHLQGRRYHISALYVVDLKRFRRIAAGDRLRGQYQALSQDPNSLANLDQDLPNNMIHQVAIKSLPQEWLWCETWCDDASKKKAKTIDLCNNPMTKEAKLSAAVRIVDEWKDYDEEIRILQRKVETGGAAVPTTPTERGRLGDAHVEL